MSFAYELKQEICGARPGGREWRLARAYGLLLFSRSFSGASISIQTEHQETACLFRSEIQALTGVERISCTEYKKRGGSTVYTASVERREDRERLLHFFGHSPDELCLRIRPEWPAGEQSCAAFVSGAYLACGNVTDPEKSYHMEFVTPHMHLCEDLVQLLSSVREAPKLTRRRSAWVAYLKESEAIEDMMTYMGGTRSALKMMEIKIYKDMRNQVNRRTNCETANLEKTVAAAWNQTEDIAYVLEARGMEYFPEELRELAGLRMDYPEMSLRELGEALREPLTRSGVNHRLKRIARIAQELRESGAGAGQAENAADGR